MAIETDDETIVTADDVRAVLTEAAEVIGWHGWWRGSTAGLEPYQASPSCQCLMTAVGAAIKSRWPGTSFTAQAKQVQARFRAALALTIELGLPVTSNHGEIERPIFEANDAHVDTTTGQTWAMETLRRAVAFVQ